MYALDISIKNKISIGTQNWHYSCSTILKKNNLKIRHMGFLNIVGFFFNLGKLILTLLQLKTKNKKKNVIALLYSKCRVILLHTIVWRSIVNVLI